MNKTREAGLTLYYDGEVADILRVSLKTVRKWRYEGKGPPWVKVGRLVYYKETDLIKWLEERKRNKIKK